MKQFTVTLNEIEMNALIESLMTQEYECKMRAERAEDEVLDEDEILDAIENDTLRDNVTDLISKLQPLLM